MQTRRRLATATTAVAAVVVVVVVVVVAMMVDMQTHTRSGDSCHQPVTCMGLAGMVGWWR